jgi:glycosyltransferase involved in cell wall biosynthesis
VDGQARAILEEANGGLAIEPENVDELLNAILRLAGNCGMAQELGRNGRDFIVRRFSRHQTAERYIRVLDRLLGVPERPSADIAA